MNDIKMNLPLFLSKVDEITNKSSKSDLEIFIHLRARILPERARDEFLEQLMNAGEETGTRDIDRDAINEMMRDKQEICAAIEKIQDGEICLCQEYNEGYSEWYDNDDEEFVYRDPDGVTDIIDEAYSVFHSFLDAELFDDAHDMAQLLMDIEIEVISDWDGDTLDLEAIDSEDLLSFNLYSFAVETLYVLYVTTKPEDRPDVMYRAICSFKRIELNIEAVMQIGREDLPQFNEFLKQWIEYLGEKSDKNAESLIKEAARLTNDHAKQEKLAKKYASSHPCLYEQILSDESRTDIGEQLGIGRDALDNIPADYIIRSRIAILTAEFAKKSGDDAFADQCLMEAYISDTCPKNYLRIAATSKNYEAHIDEMKSLYNSRRNSEAEVYRGIWQAYELRRNSMSEYEYYALLFLGGEFRKMINEGMKTKESLGWSSTFMKQGMALLILLLNRSGLLSHECESMCGYVIDTMGFGVGAYTSTYHEDRKKNIDRFWDWFSKWKLHALITAEDHEFIIKKLEHWIEVRVEGIMNKNRRNYYGECAAFIAAFGEACESVGYKYTKLEYMEMYRKKYSRRTAFRAELKAFGLR